MIESQNNLRMTFKEASIKIFCGIYPDEGGIGGESYMRIPLKRGIRRLVAEIGGVDDLVVIPNKLTTERSG